MIDLFLPIHNALHEMLGEKFCGWPGALGFCPEFWFGFISAGWLVKSDASTKFIDIIAKFNKKDKKYKEQ